MVSPSEDSANTANQLQPLTEQDIINQTQEQLLELIRVSSDEEGKNWQKMPVRLGDWSGTLESEISQFIW